MPSARTRNSPLLSSGLRLAALYAMLLALAFAITALVVWRTATATAESELRQKIQLEVDAIAHELDAEGLDAAVAAIAARTERPGAPEYWLTDAIARPLVGDLPAMEGPNGWHEVRLPEDKIESGGEGRNDLLVLTRSFPSGVRLSVGEDLAQSRRTINQTITILMEVGTVSILLVLLAGYLITRNSWRRLDDMTNALGEVGAGDLAARVPVRAQFFSTDMDRVATGINRMLDRNEVLVEGLRRVSRDVAHDLRTPLSHLRQRLERAKMAEGRDKDRAIAQAEEDTEQIIATFDAILRLAEIQAGAAKARFAAVDLGEIAETVASAYAPDVEEAGQSLRCEASKWVAVEGDRELLTQAIANLVENALRHTPGGSKIIVAAGRDTGPTLTVEDDGNGVPAETLQALMTPFYRLDPSRSTRGAGLGLSIVKAIADLHDAELLLENLDGGFRATIRFPKKSL